MAVYERILAYQSDPETLVRWGAYLFILIGFLNSLNANFLALQIFDGTVYSATTDLVAGIFILDLWDFLIAFFPTLLFGIGALSFLNIAFDEDQLIWLRMVALIAIVVLLFGSLFGPFLF
ncbi:MAG: hypothetical protein ACW981_09710 [Candidatus Hodarchaeales archaeon]|jgi:hypothetical protein